MDGQKLPFYRLTVTETLDELRSTDKGLGKTESADRLKHLGINRLEHAKHTSGFVIFVRQFKNLLVGILIVSAGLSFYLSNVKTAIIMLLIAFMNAAVGFL